MDIKNNTDSKTAAPNEQQLENFNNTNILLNIEAYLKSIAESLDKIANHGVTTNPTGFYLKNTNC